MSEETTNQEQKSSVRKSRVKDVSPLDPNRNKPATEEQIAIIKQLIDEQFMHEIEPDRWKTLTQAEAKRVIDLGNSRKERQAKVVKAN